jgi:RimJ/RimL family protein N-acetyltransferase
VNDLVVLEQVRDSNAMTLWRLMQASDLREFQDVPRFTREEFRRRVALRPIRFEKRAIGRFEWIVIERSSGKPCGWVSLRFGDHPAGTAELGYSLLAPFRGRGYAASAVKTLLEAAFAYAHLERIEACFIPANTPSQSLLDRLGFEFVRLQRDGAVVRGRAVDIAIYRLSRERYAAQGSSANSIEISASGNPK